MTGNVSSFRFTSGAPVKRNCAACNAPLQGKQRRACSEACRLRAWRGHTYDPTQDLAATLGLTWRDFWRTPPELLVALVAEFGPCGLDAAATELDAVAPAWITPQQNALTSCWAELAAPGWWWCNPPYSRAGGGLLAWVRRTWEQTQAGPAGQLAILLVPPGVGTQYRVFALAAAPEVRDLDKRQAFLNPKTGRPTRGNREGSSLILFRQGERGPARVRVWPPG